MNLVVELPFAMHPLDMDDELEATGIELIQAYARLRDTVLQAYESGYTVSRISELTGLSLEIVVEVVREGGG